MRRSVGLAALLSAFVLGAAPPLNAEPSYHRATVLTAQEALTRLGYDVGEPDGAWGPKTRAAMNALRAEHDLPAAEDFTGSSLALVHRLSPGEATLDRPGFFYTDIVARRAWLADHEDVSISQCIPVVGGKMRPLLDFPPKIDSTAAVEGQPGDSDWWSEFGEILTGYVSRCMSGEDAACQALVDAAGTWADVDALQTNDTPRDYGYENTKVGANYTLRGLMIGYGIARQIVPVPPDREASILDWFKKRTDKYHHIFPDNSPVGSTISTRADNHGVANYVPALTFGILVGDRSMMQPALDNWREALLFMRPDGSFPTEMNRGGVWLHQSTLHLGRLIATAELAAPHGIDLYAEFADPRYSIPNAFRFLLDALEDFDVAAQYSMENWIPFDDLTPRTPQIRGHAFAFIPVYAERFGYDENMRRLATGTVDEEVCDEHMADEGKFQDDLRLCQKRAGQTIPMNMLIETVYPQPNWHMGYPAGCVQGTKTWRQLLGFESP